MGPRHRHLLAIAFHVRRDTLNADLSAGGFGSSTLLVGFTDDSNGVLALRVADAVTQSDVPL